MLSYLNIREGREEREEVSENIREIRVIRDLFQQLTLSCKKGRRNMVCWRRPLSLT
jgi:hypothetical protein